MLQFGMVSGRKCVISGFNRGEFCETPSGVIMMQKFRFFVLFIQIMYNINKIDSWS